MKEIERSTYHLLDWLGDCGGLYDALSAIADFLVFPFTSFALSEKLLSTMALYQTSKAVEKGETKEETKKKTRGGLPENDVI